MHSNVKKLLEDKIFNLEETLKYHALHVEVLRDLLKEINQDTGRIEVIPPAQKPESRTKNIDGLVPVAREIATMIRKHGKTKAYWGRVLHEAGQITDSQLKNISPLLSPTTLGKELHDEIFEGTKYV